MILRLFFHIVKHPLHMLAMEGFVEGRLFHQCTPRVPCIDELSDLPSHL